MHERLLMRAQLFAAKARGARDAPEQRPRGAFGQDLPRPLPSDPGI